MKIKVAEATNIQLDWLVAKAEGNLYPIGDIRLLDGNVFSIEAGDYERSDRWQQYSPSTDWEQGGPIIEREKIEVTPPLPDWCRKDNDLDWMATSMPHDYEGVTTLEVGPTPLIAAMRCFVVSKLGEEVEVPDGLFKA